MTEGFFATCREISVPIASGIDLLWRWGEVWLRYVSLHTGIPVTAVAAASIVLSYRAFGRSLRLLVEFGIAFAFVVMATQLGWIHW